MLKILKKILNFIFSIKNKNTHKQICIFGIKIKLKNKNTNESIKPDYNNQVIDFKIGKMLSLFESYFYHRWITQTDETFNYFVQNFITSNQEIMTPKITLMVISTLIENKSFTQVNFLLQKYLESYNEDYIHEFLLISDYLCKKGKVNNEKIRKAQELFRLLELSEKNKAFDNLVKNKTIAIVGNGLSEIGKNKKDEIDSKDIVIRFNNFANDEEKYKNDYGTKTDIWMIANNLYSEDVYKKDLKDLKAILIEPDFYHQIFSDKYVEFLLNIINYYKIPIISLDFEFRKKLRRETNLLYPSSGFQIIKYVLSKSESTKKINLYGFSFQDENNLEENILSRYYEKREIHFMWHNFFKESELLKVNEREYRDNVFYKEV